MKKTKVIYIVTIFVAIMMISIGLVLEKDLSTNFKYSSDIYNFKVQNMAASSNMILKGSKEEEKEAVKPAFEEVQMETAPASVIIPPRVEVYEAMTLEELGEKLNRSLGSDIVAGKGPLIAAECINKGVDPYIATAILLHETGCGSSCSNLARSCFNFGGQKGSPGCNGGAYKTFSSIDEGLVGLIDNLNNNYFSRGLNTVESIGPKYAESGTWVSKINWYIDKIRNN